MLGSSSTMGTPRFTDAGTCELLGITLVIRATQKAHLGVSSRAEVGTVGPLLSSRRAVCSVSSDRAFGIGQSPRGPLT